MPYKKGTHGEAAIMPIMCLPSLMPKQQCQSTDTDIKSQQIYKNTSTHNIALVILGIYECNILLKICQVYSIQVEQTFDFKDDVCIC